MDESLHSAYRVNSVFLASFRSTVTTERNWVTSEWRERWCSVHE